MGVKDHDDCFFCDCNPETIEQLFGTVTGYSPLERPRKLNLVGNTN